VFRLFSVRQSLWKGEVLLPDEQRFWDSACSQMPSWALFQRQTISDDDQHAQDEAERAARAGRAELFSRADKVTVSEKDGVQSFSLTFDLKKKQPLGKKIRSRWKRTFFRRLPPKN
jgi:hypothetical protein